MDFEQEWQDVKRELWKLSNITIYTISNGDYNYIGTISEKGFPVTTKNGYRPAISWSEIRSKYAKLSTKGTLGPKQFGNGSFIRSLVAHLTTVDGTNRELLYLPKELPVRLRPTQEWPRSNSLR